MRLKTLGELRLVDIDFNRVKPLLLLTYLVVEGPKDRRFLAELFWAEAADPLNSLARALSHLRKTSPELVGTDKVRAWPLAQADVADLLSCLDEGQAERAAELYKGAFLENVYLSTWSTELEEWVYSTREFIAARMRAALLNLAEEAAASGHKKEAIRYAEQAIALKAAPAPEPSTLKRTHSLLSLGHSPYMTYVKEEAESYGLELLELGPPSQNQLPSAPPETPHNLASRGTSFIGRDLEIAELGEMLRKGSCRLITLLGQGGTGKTRLALQLAQGQLASGQFPGGVYFVELEFLLQPSALAPKMAEALGLSLQGQEEPSIQVQKYLQDKDVLLILDNFEHLLEAAASVSELLGRCPRLKLLVTSRARLQLEEEWLFSLGGLLYPSGDQVDVAQARGFEAVDLFVERVLQADRSFKLTPETWPAVADICALVGGSPLALELAATWIGVVPLSDMVTELKRDLDLLSTQTRKVARHQSIWATFEYSWALLTPQEQTVLKKLSVFKGGFTRSAAAEVASASIPMLASLLGKSLLQTAPTGRYDFHPLLKHYLREKLSEAEAPRVFASHADYYFGLLKQFRQARRGPKEPEALDAIGADLDNCLAAWRWAVTEAKIECLYHTNELCVYFDKRSRCQEGIEVFKEAAASLNETDPSHRHALSVLLHRQAKLYLVLRQAELAKGLAERSVDLARGLQDEAVLSKALTMLGAATKSLGDYARANLYFQEALKLAGATDGSEQDATYLMNLARAERALGNFEEAGAHLHQALKIKRDSGDQFGEVMALNQLGILSETTGAYKQAEAFWQEALDLAEAISYNSRIPFLLYNLGSCYLRRGESDQAQHLAQDILRMTKSHADPTVEIIAYSLLGRQATKRGAYRQALAHLQQSLNYAWQNRAMTRVLENLVWLAEWWAEQDLQEEACKLLRLIEAYLAMDSHVTAKAQMMFKQVAATSSASYAVAPDELSGDPKPLEDIVKEALAIIAP